MKKNKILKVIGLLIVFILIVSINMTAFADEPIDLTNSIQSGNENDTEEPGENNTVTTPGDTQTGNDENNTTTTPGGNTQGGNSVATPNENNTNVAPTPSAGTNNNNNNSSYEESQIPYAGAESSILMIAAFVVCAIIGIYTFMKLSEYSSI